MSVYGGFATRQQEHLYNMLVERALRLLVGRFVLGGANTSPEPRWTAKMHKIYQVMKSLDKAKHLAPHYSTTLKPLIDNLQQYLPHPRSKKRPSPPLNESRGGGIGGIGAGFEIRKNSSEVFMETPSVRMIGPLPPREISLGGSSSFSKNYSLSQKQLGRYESSQRLSGGQLSRGSGALRSSSALARSSKQVVDSAHFSPPRAQSPSLRERMNLEYLRQGLPMTQIGYRSEEPISRKIIKQQQQQPVKAAKRTMGVAGESTKRPLRNLESRRSQSAKRGGAVFLKRSKRSQNETARFAEKMRALIQEQASALGPTLEGCFSGDEEHRQQQTSLLVTPLPDTSLGRLSPMASSPQRPKKWMLRPAPIMAKRKTVEPGKMRQEMLGGSFLPGLGGVERPASQLRGASGTIRGGGRGER